MGNENLTEMRGRIDAIDDQIAILVSKRIELSNMVMKSKPPGQIVDSQREQAIIQRYSVKLENVSTATKSKKLALAVIGASSQYPES